MSQEFIDQLYRYHKCLQSEALADCFGITKDPTSCYIPTVSQICEYLGNWTSNLSNQFEEEYVNLEKLNLWSLPCHEKAIYFSRLLDF
ncbi:unnamed protein product [Rhizophagus irregularis]|nr:unnamed protein product [Rhizophagus irregularis]